MGPCQRFGSTTLAPGRIKNPARQAVSPRYGDSRASPTLGSGAQDILTTLDRKRYRVVYGVSIVDFGRVYNSTTPDYK